MFRWIRYPASSVSGSLRRRAASAARRDRCFLFGRTLQRWRDQIIAWHQAKVTNGPTEAINNLIKRIKRIGFGFRRFDHYRIRVVLYAGRPNWDLLTTIHPAQIR